MDGQTETSPGLPTPDPSKPTESMLPAMLFVAGVFILVMIFMNRARRRTSRGATPMDQLAAIRARAAGRTDSLDEVKADVQELAQRLASQLDNKAERLEQLIRDADERIARMSGAQGDGQARGPDTPLRVPEAPRTDPTRLRIYELADQGLSPVEIARKLDQPTGQIELVLSLRRA